MMKCDLHVHSIFSGMVNKDILRHVGHDSYSDPAAVYARCRARGMTAVTLTDHDTIEGALTLRDHPDVFASEEVSVRVPGGRVIHVGAYGIDAAQHAQIAARRNDAESLFAYLREQDIPAAFNHPFAALTGPRRVGDLDCGFDGLAMVETRNGMMPPVVNRAAADVAGRLGRGECGGSDAHTLASVARAYTVVPEARSIDDFLAGLRAGKSFAAGSEGSFLHLTGDVARVVAAGYVHTLAHAFSSAREMARLLALIAILPIIPLLPLITAREMIRARSFARRFHQGWRARHSPILEWTETAVSA